MVSRTFIANDECWTTESVPSPLDLELRPVKKEPMEIDVEEESMEIDDRYLIHLLETNFESDSLILQNVFFGIYSVSIMCEILLFVLKNDK